MDRSVLVALLSALVVGCSSDEGSMLDPQPPQPADAGDGASRADGARDSGTAPPWQNSLVEPLDWQPCPLYDVGDDTADAGADGSDGATDWGDGMKAPPPMAECAETRMPLLHEKDDGRTIGYFVKRLPARQQPARGQLWLLSGGPGQPGMVFWWWAQIVAEHVPDLDIYIPDHRGTGASEKFDCPSATRNFIRDPSERCIQEVAIAPDREGFRTTEAAFDVAQLIHHTSHDREVLVYGGSYGGYWLHRLLQVAPDLLTAAVFDGSSHPLGLGTALEIMDDAESAGRHVLGLCAADAACAEHFDDIDADVINARVNALADECPLFESFDRVADAKAIMGLALERFELKKLVPAALFHLLSCTEAGYDWFDAFVSETVSSARHRGDEYARGLNMHINLSELLGEPVDPAEFEGAERDWLFASVETAVVFNDRIRTYPAYEADRFSKAWAESAADILILHGDLDSRTPIDNALALAGHFDAPNQQFVRFPTGGHAVTFASHDYDDELSCGEHVLFQFLRNSSSAVDTTCVEETPPLDFNGDPEVVRKIAGFENAWKSGDVP